ncbi:MAG: VOC family protein [Bacteroidetes bacterium]|nr:MAG: VOC family protein [Bacteroidota bacterium]
MSAFNIEFLDHVAIRVKDINASAKWYNTVLGLKRYQLAEWGEFPIFMLSNKTGVALFPANTDDTKLETTSKNVKIDHFAFNVTGENFEKARKRYDDLDLEYNFQDHFYFHSIYTKDPDGHTVELTTIVVDENTFYH